MKILQEYAILIKKSLSVKAVWCTKAVEWISRQGLEKLEPSTVCWKESARRIQLSGNQAAVDRVRRVALAVEDLVLIQGDEPKRHRSAREISHETAILCSSVHRIIHHNLQLKCFKRRRAQR